MALIFDLETNGLLNELTKIHCAWVHDTETNAVDGYDPERGAIIDGVARIRDASCIIGHNIIGFDIPVLHKLYPNHSPKGSVIDTYVWAACLFPNIKDTDYNLYRKGVLPASCIGKHTLEAWGYRLGIYKGEFAKTTDWTTWTPEMSKYCRQDVTVTHRLVDYLRQQRTSWEQVALEQDVMKILNRQERHGVLFDVREAEALYSKLNGKREKLRKDIQESFPPFFKRVGKLFTPKRNNKTTGYVAGAACQKIELVEFNPSSSAHIARMLMMKYNWKPIEFAAKEFAPVELQYHYARLGITANTTPKIDDETLERLPYPEAKPLAEFQMLQKRCAMLAEGTQAWLRCYDEKTHRIHGAINQFGAVTGRCIHFKPNLGQVTAPRSPYGKECRSLFTVPEGWWISGTDADGLEARCMAHFIARYDSGDLVKCILEGTKENNTDIHSLNRNRLGFNSRDVAKTWFYAFSYGSGNANLGMVGATDDNYKGYAGDPAKLGSKLRAKLAKEFTGLKQLIDAVQAKAKITMSLRGLDGRRIPVRAIYSALNTLLQGAGAVVMKKALVLADDLLCAEGLLPVKDYVQVLFVHDELQYECRTKEIAEIAGKCACDAIRLAGEHFKLRCPLAGSSKIGKTWYDTH